MPKSEPTITLDSIGFNIKEQREKKKLSQAAVAKHCNVSIVAYQRWEYGTSKNIRQSSAIKLREILCANE